VSFGPGTRGTGGGQWREHADDDLGLRFWLTVAEPA
jgi:hypothetical protein